MTNRIRACNILVTRALKNAEFVSREDLEAIIADSVYSTTVNKTMGYINDIKVYHGGNLEYKKNSKTITHVRLKNAHEFNKQGQKMSAEEKLAQAIEIEKLALSLQETVTDMSDSFAHENEVVMTAVYDHAVVYTNNVKLLTYDATADLSDVIALASLSKKETASLRMRKMNAARKAA